MKTLLLLAISFALVGPASAQETVTIDDLNLGTWWAGPAVTRDDLVGKVVLVPIWGS